MTRSWLAKFFLALALASGAGHALAQDFILHTQNLLRFGQGATANKNAKCTALNTISANVDIIVIQELMQADYPCSAVPTGFKWESYGPLGPNSYKEYYGFLWRNVPRTNGPTITDGALIDSANASSFMRPPYATFLFIQPHGKTVKYGIWIANIHSIWGKGVSPRKAEATAAAVFFSALKKSPAGSTQPPKPNGFPVIIAGDWNLPARNKYGTTNSGFDDLVSAGASIEPNVPTSLTKAGKGSSPYDHFAFTYSSLKIATPTLYPVPTSWATWRSTVSDHLGVQVGVTFK